MIDLRQQLGAAIAEYYRTPIDVLSLDEFTTVLDHLAHEAGIPLQTMRTWATPLFERIELQHEQLALAQYQSIAEEIAAVKHWVVVTPGAVQAFADALALNSGGGTAPWEMTIAEFLRRAQRPHVLREAWLTDVDGLTRLRQIVSDIPAAPLRIDGLGSARAIVDFIQDEGPGSDLGFAAWCRRLAAAVGVADTLVVGLIREIGEPTSVASSQARFRVRHLILDERRLDAFCRRLAAVARSHGVAVTPLQMRQAIARVRLRADRGGGAKQPAIHCRYCATCRHH